MNIAVLPGNHFQATSNCTPSQMDFAPALSALNATSNSCSPKSSGRRARNLRVVGTPIDQAFNRVDVLGQLDKATLERMATDSTTPIAVLQRLALHPNSDVRAAVAENESTPMYTIWSLSKDTDANVRLQLAENHNLPTALIRSLTGDENPYVACRAQQTYDRLQAV
jgi:hypothetical protein